MGDLDDWTPSTSDVRATYTHGEVDATRLAQFDRWLAEHDRQVAMREPDQARAEVVDELLDAKRRAEVAEAEVAEAEVESLREWSNDLAELMPPEYDGEEAQEDIILHWARDVHDDQNKQHTEALARAEQAERWLDEIEQAAGMGSVADVANRQRELGVEGDHETRLRIKRVAKLKATVMEETEWRREVLNEWQVRAEAAETKVARVQKLHTNAGESQGYDDTGYTDLGDCCGTCGAHGEYGVPWPCPTIRALDVEGAS